MVQTDSGTFLLAHTSPEAARAAVGGRDAPSIQVPYRALVADWSEHDWGLVVNPGQPLAVWFTADQVVRMAAPELDDPRRPEGRVVLAQVVPVFSRGCPPCGVARGRGSGTTTVPRHRAERAAEGPMSRVVRSAQ